MPQVGIVATDGTSGPQILVCQRGTGRRGRLDKWFKRDLKYKPVSLKLMELIGCTHLAHLRHGEILGKLHLKSLLARGTCSFINLVHRCKSLKKPSTATQALQLWIFDGYTPLAINLDEPVTQHHRRA